MVFRRLKPAAEHPDGTLRLAGGQGPDTMPVRRLITLGVTALAVALMVGVIIGTRSLTALNQGFDKLERSRVYADALRDMSSAAFKEGWAALLADHNRPEEARSVQREAASVFDTSYERARGSGMADRINLHTLRRLYDESRSIVAEEIEAETEPDEAFHARLFSVHQQMDELLVRLGSNADQVVNREAAAMVETVERVTRGLVITGMLGVLLCVVAGIFLTIRILRSLDHPVSLIAGSTGRLASSAQYHVKSAADQSAAMVQISSTMQQLVASFRDMTDSSHDLVRTSKDAAEECHKGHALLLDSQHGMEQIKREVGRITEHMRTLVDKSQQINGVLEMINELASQTNLLSINATIEAAGAGEAGRRFAVVAEEIRLLAERAVEFTEEIRALIEDIQDTAHVTSVATAEGALSVDRGLGKTSKIADNFDTLITLVTRTADAVQAIESTTREQVHSVEQVTEAVESLSHIASESEQQAVDTLDTLEHLRGVSRDLQLIAGRKPTLEGGE